MHLVCSGFLGSISLLYKEFIAWQLKIEQKCSTQLLTQGLFITMRPGLRSYYKGIATWSVLQRVLRTKQSLWQLTQARTQCSLFGILCMQILNELTSLHMSGELKLLISVLMLITSLLCQVVLIKLSHLKRFLFGIWIARVMNLLLLKHLLTIPLRNNMQWSLTPLTLKKLLLQELRAFCSSLGTKIKMEWFTMNHWFWRILSQSLSEQKLD